MSELRRINDWKGCMEAILMVMENPFAERGYRLLKDAYIQNGMTEQGSAIDFLIGQKFHDHGSNSRSEQ